MPRARTQLGKAICAASVSELAVAIQAMPATAIAGTASHSEGENTTATDASACTPVPQRTNWSRPMAWRSRGRYSAAPAPLVEPQPDEGPVMVTVEYLIDPSRAADFIEIMEQTRRARLRQGALSWGLFRDPAVPGRYLEYFLDETWVEHLRRLERFTASDVGLRERRLAFHLGGEPPRVQRFIGESIV